MPERRELTAEELDFVRANYRAMPHRDIQERLGVRQTYLSTIARRLGLTRRLHRWTEEEDEYIRASWGVRGLGEVALHLGRGLSEVSQRSRTIGVTAPGVRWKKNANQRDANGYLVAYHRDGRYVPVHMDVMERHLGRRMRDGECVHHVNGDKDDNRIENLHLCEGASAHRYAHMSVERLMPQLLERGVVRFDRDQGIYVLCETGK